MLEQMNDIHREYYLEGKLILDEKYRYDFLNIPPVRILSTTGHYLSPYFFVFATEKEHPNTVFINIVPHDILDPIQITRHQDIHFYYPDDDYVNKALVIGEKPLIIHDSLKIIKNNNDYIAVINNQLYYDWREEMSHKIKEINYLLFSVNRIFYNAEIIYPLNFWLQIKIFENHILGNSAINQEEDRNKIKNKVSKYFNIDKKLNHELDMEVTSKRLIAVDHYQHGTSNKN